MSKTYENIKVFDFRAETDFQFKPNVVREVKNLSPNVEKNCVMMFYVIEYCHSDG